MEPIKHFHHHLYGASFITQTDHAALRWLRSLKSTETLLTTSVGKLDQFNYRTEHRSGRIQGNVDGSSRHPCEMEYSHCIKRDPVEVDEKDTWETASAILLVCKKMWTHGAGSARYMVQRKVTLRALLQLYVGRPMDWRGDVAGPSLTTPRGNRFVVVATDYFTKWPAGDVLPNNKAKTVAKLLVDKFWTRFGLHSVQGREFEGKVFSDSCKLSDIHNTSTSALHPQANDMGERWNKTMQQCLAKHCSEDQSDWMNISRCCSWLTVLQSMRQLPMDLAMGRP